MNQEIKEKFQQLFIPTIERMLEKEQKHLNDLELMYQETGNVELNSLNKTLYDLIILSRNHKDYLELRLKQYKEYTL